MKISANKQVELTAIIVRLKQFNMFLDSHKSDVNGCRATAICK
jgi:hypothetical protein